MNSAVYLSPKIGPWGKETKGGRWQCHSCFQSYYRGGGREKNKQPYTVTGAYGDSLSECSSVLRHAMEEGENKADLLDWGKELSESDVQGEQIRRGN